MIPVPIPRVWPIDAGQVSCNLAAMMIARGRLKTAQASLTTLVPGGLHLAEVLAASLASIKGEFRAAGEIIERLRLISAEENDPRLAFQVEVVATIRALLQHVPSGAVAAAAVAREYAAESGQRAEDYLVCDLLELAAGLATLGAGEGDLPLSDRLPKTISRAEDEVERLGLRRYESLLFLEEAHLHHLKGNTTQAFEFARRASDLALDQHLLLERACAELLLAEVEEAEGRTDSARGHALQARKAALCDGPPHCFKPVLVAAERMLR